MTADDWDGKERRTEAPSRFRRTRYRMHRFLDGLAEESVLLGVALIAVFIILAVLAVGIASVNRRSEIEARKTRHLITCVVEGFVADGEVAPEEQAARIFTCLREGD